jgi:hypothetical protein
VSQLSRLLHLTAEIQCLQEERDELGVGARLDEAESPCGFRGDGRAGGPKPRAEVGAGLAGLRRRAANHRTRTSGGTAG